MLEERVKFLNKAKNKSAKNKRGCCVDEID